MSDLFIDCVTQKHLELLERLQPMHELALIGGTALSLQIGHRKSFDLDFVVPSTVTNSLVQHVLQALRATSVIQRMQNDDQWTAICDGISITVFTDTAPFLHHMIVEKKLGNITNIHDIFSTKLFILGRRAAWRDYVDIATCIRHRNMVLKNGIKEAVQRYSVAERWILEPLTYFDDLEKVPVEWVRYEMTNEEVQKIIENEIRSIPI